MSPVNAGDHHTRVEVCVDDLAGVLTAERMGADRVELCSALATGGLTPSIGTVATVAARATSIGVQVLIRPRPGDFVYDRDELDVMVADIAAVREHFAVAAVPLGFVIGALTAGSEVDRAACAELVAACGPAPVAFHRAFDLTPDLTRSLDTLIELGIGRVLTGGGAQRASDGAPALAELIERAAGRIVVMPGGSVRPDNVAVLVTATGADEVHFRAPENRANHMSPRYPTVQMTGPVDQNDETRTHTSAAMVQAVRIALSGQGATV